MSFTAVFFTLIFLNLTIGCSYYNVRNVTTSTDIIAQQMDDFAKNQNYVILHYGSDFWDTWHLNNLEVNESEKSITGMVQRVGPKHIPPKERSTKRTHQFDGSKEVLNEVHFYINTSKTYNPGDIVSIPFSEINTISVNDRNTGKTVLNIVGGIVGTMALIVIIVALTKSSCPFVYVKNGEEFVFTGELYPGVLTANQQRDDYLLLPKNDDAIYDYNIKITNELKEIQYTDFVQLLEVSHSEGLKVLLDKDGNLHTFKDIIAPKSVLIDNAKRDKEPSLNKDNASYLFNTDISSSSSLRNIQLSFNKPQKAEDAKLFLTVKNSLWLDYVFGKFNEQFGTYYNKFQKDQQKASLEKSTKWMNSQNIPLSVYLKMNNGWELVGRINTVGPMAYRDIAVPIDLSNIQGEEVIIKLETGFMFWELDYVGIDYSENVDLVINYINPSRAIDNNNRDVTHLISIADNTYFVQPNVGDEVIVSFNVSQKIPDLDKTFFLKNRGYYNYIRDYKGEPNFQELRLFKEAGAFTDFSMYEYQVLIDYENQFNVIALNTK